MTLPATESSRHLIDLFADSERIDSDAKRDEIVALGGIDDLTAASLAVSAVCESLATKNNLYTARPAIKAARKQIASLKTTEMSTTQARIGFSEIELDLIEAKQEPAKTFSVFAHFKDNVYGWLEKAIWEYKYAVEDGDLGAVRDWKGFLTEQTALALLNRTGFPLQMTLPSLPHNDRGVIRAKNYDLVLLDTAPEGYATVRHLQVKRLCQGFRPNHVTNKPAQERYQESMHIISGCCDLGMQDDDHNLTEVATKLPELLLHEVRRSLPDASRAYLDYRQNALLAAIFSNSRKGLVQYEEQLAA